MARVTAFLLALLVIAMAYSDRVQLRVRSGISAIGRSGAAMVKERLVPAAKHTLRRASDWKGPPRRMRAAGMPFNAGGAGYGD